MAGEASAQYNVNRWFGLKADFSGHYGKLLTARFATFPPFGPLTLAPSEHTYGFVFGPVASYRTHRYTAFVHCLLGGEHVGSSSFQTQPIPIALPTPSFSETDFAVAMGGGLDARLTRHISIRAGQFDYQFVRSSGGGHQNDFLFSTGVVFGFGGK